MDRLSPNERTRCYQANRDYRAHVEFDQNTRLTPEERAAVLAVLANAAARRPTPAAPKPTKPTAHPTLRILGQLDLARTRRRLLELLPIARAGEALREIVWAVDPQNDHAEGFIAYVRNMLGKQFEELSIDLITDLTLSLIHI